MWDILYPSRWGTHKADAVGVGGGVAAAGSGSGAGAAGQGGGGAGHHHHLHVGGHHTEHAGGSASRQRVSEMAAAPLSPVWYFNIVLWRSKVSE